MTAYFAAASAVPRHNIPAPALREHQPRERSVACIYCLQPTWAIDAVCDRCHVIARDGITAPQASRPTGSNAGRGAASSPRPALPSPWPGPLPVLGAAANSALAVLPLYRRR